MTTKPTLRAEAHRRRATLTRANYSEMIAAFAEALDLAPGAVVAGYYPVRDEADPRGLMATLYERGHPLALPAIVPGEPLIFRKWRVGEPLHANPAAFNIPEPPPDAPAAVPAVVLVPLLAFDAEGHRLGYGGGYYDRTLDALPDARAIGVAYSGQEVTHLPREAHDRRLDAVITERGVRRFR